MIIPMHLGGILKATPHVMVIIILQLVLPDLIRKTQLSDGSWTIPWGWNDYPEQWAIAKNWWKSDGILVNMLYLKNMGKI